MTAAIVPRLSAFDRYVAEVEAFPLLSREEEVTLARRLRDQGDVAAAHRLVVCNLRFVVKVAHGYAGYGLRLLDLIQEGNLGLMQAVRKFDPERGYRLITYAVWWIRAHIQAFVVRSWSLVKIGAGNVTRKLFFKLRSERSRVEQQRFGDASTAELAEQLGVGEDHVDEMSVRLAARDFSLDAPVGAGDAAHVDLLADRDGGSQETHIARSEERALLAEALEATREMLSDKDRFILEHRLLADEPMTLAEIGGRIGVSRQRVLQLETRLLDRLREALPARPPLQRDEPALVAP